MILKPLLGGGFPSHLDRRDPRLLPLDEKAVARADAPAVFFVQAAEIRMEQPRFDLADGVGRGRALVDEFQQFARAFLESFFCHGHFLGFWDYKELRIGHVKKANGTQGATACRSLKLS